MTYIDNFRARTTSSFALSYTLDLSVMRQMGDDASSLYVLHGITDENRKVFIIGPVNDDARVIPAGPYFMQEDGNLCPPRCDASFSAAVQLERTVAEQYIENFRRAGIDELRAFLIPRSVIRSLKSNDRVRNIKVFRAMDGDRPALVVAGVGALGESITTSIYLQDETTLCPPRCDAEGDDGAPL